MSYRNYATQKETPSRKTRKGDRGNVFEFNKKMTKRLREERLERQRNRVQAD